MEHIPCDSVPYEAIGESGIEAVAGADGTDRLDLFDRIFLFKAMYVNDLQGRRAESAYEIAAAGRKLFTEYLPGVIHTEEGDEILMAPPYHIRKGEILPQCITYVPKVLNMGRTEIHVIVQDRPAVLRMLQETPYDAAAGRIEGIE